MMTRFGLRALSVATALLLTAGLAQAAESGANSFTEGQAKSRIEAAGYGNVTSLKKDDQGVWRGMADKDGKSQPVSLDFKGNIATQ